MPATARSAAVITAKFQAISCSLVRSDNLSRSPRTRSPVSAAAAAVVAELLSRLTAGLNISSYTSQLYSIALD